MSFAVLTAICRALGAVCAQAILLVTLSAAAQAQCNNWASLGSLGYFGDVTTGLEVDPSSGDLVYASTEPPQPYGPTARVYRQFGSAWGEITPSELAGGATGEANGLRVLDDGTGARLHVFGRRGSTMGYVRRLDAGSWSTPVPDAPSEVTDLAVFDFGAGPEYVVVRNSGALERFHSGAWTTLGGIPPPPPSHINAEVTPYASLIVHTSATGSTLYVASGSGVERWDSGAWTSIGALTAANQNFGPRLRSLTTNSGTFLYLAGRFAAVADVPANGLARWDGNAWQGLGQPGVGTLDVTAFDAGNGNGTQLYTWIANLGFTRQESSGWTTLPSPLGLTVIGTLVGSGLRNGSANRPELWVGGWQDLPNNGESYVHAWSSCDSAGEIGCVGDGSSTACPCANESVASERAGCLNSLGMAGSLRGGGQPSLTDDTFALSGANMTNASALYFQGANFHTASPLGDGLKCVGGPFRRLATRVNSAGASTYPMAGEIALSTLGQVQAPGTRHYQVRYRNVAAFCTVEPFNYTNSLTVVWQL